jgi:coenzyme F420-reducing hydrogenase beta subunit
MITYHIIVIINVYMGVHFQNRGAVTALLVAALQEELVDCALVMGLVDVPISHIRASSIRRKIC